MLSSNDTLCDVPHRTEDDPLVQEIVRKLVPTHTPEAQDGYRSETYSRAVLDVQDAIWCAERVGAVVSAG